MTDLEDAEPLGFSDIEEAESALCAEKGVKLVSGRVSVNEGEEIRIELLEACKSQPELTRFLLMSGKERHRHAPTLFTSKGRLMSAYRQESSVYHHDGQIYKEEIAAEIRHALKTMPKLLGYAEMSGKDRYKKAPDMFTTKGRLLHKYRSPRDHDAQAKPMEEPKSFTQTMGNVPIRPNPEVAKSTSGQATEMFTTNGRLLHSEQPTPDRDVQAKCPPNIGKSPASNTKISEDAQLSYNVYDNDLSLSEDEWNPVFGDFETEWDQADNDCEGVSEDEQDESDDSSEDVNGAERNEADKDSKDIGRNDILVESAPGRASKGTPSLSPLSRSKEYVQTQFRIWESAKSFTDQDYLDMYALLSKKQRWRLAPDKFNSKGEFKRHLTSLQKRASVIVVESRSRNGAHGRMRNLPYLADMNIDGTIIRCSAWRTSLNPSSIVVAFTRASGRAPKYGQFGMFQRAQRAAEVFSDLYNEPNAVLLAIPRVRISSRTSFFNQHGLATGEAGQSLSELWNILGIAKPRRSVYLLCVGFDSLTTNVNNYVNIADKWQHLHITIVLVVPATFDRNLDVFQLASNGILYAIIPIMTIKMAVEGTFQATKARELIDLCGLVNGAKEHLEYRHELEARTARRANFRVHPHTPTENGIEPDLTHERLLADLARARAICSIP